MKSENDYLELGPGISNEQENSELNKQIHRLLMSSCHKVILTVGLETSHARRKKHLLIVSAAVAVPIPSKLNRKDILRQSAPPAVLSRDRMSSARVKMDRNSPSMDLDYCLLGVDSWKEPSVDGGEEVEVATIGFVSKILWGTTISLDGDGGFGLHILQRHFVFKPVTLQCLWTTLQTLHAISTRLKPKRNSMLVDDWDWVTDYQEQINSPQSCINEWNEMPDLLSRRPMSPDKLSVLSSDAADAETKKTVIKSTLREIMKTVDLDDITSKSIRLRLETDLEQKLEEFKGFIDEEILLILGQMDPASRIFDFLYLGSEWNASNLEELNSNGITHILNVTREIDNFFPAVFKYLNVREYDVEETDLLKYWDETFNFIQACIQLGGKVLVHCKMGISRSASTVMAFAMKYFGWPLDRALAHTKERRSIVNPNSGFRHQLRVYEGILEASRQRNNFRLHRSKSESSMKKADLPKRREGRGHSRQGSQAGNNNTGARDKKKAGKRCTKKRPASWSPPDKMSRGLDLEQGQDQYKETSGPTSTPPAPVVYHCYSHLAALLSPSSPPSSALPSTFSPSSVRTDVYTLPGLRKESSDARDTSVSISSVSSQCPAQFHIDQCTCNFELELKVSDAPVDLFEQTGETDQVLRNFSNFPRHFLRNQQRSITVDLSDIRDTSPYRDSTCQEPGEPFLETDRLDTSGAEELSVKTLADMFDFRLGEQPTKPPLAKSKEKLLITKMDRMVTTKLATAVSANTAISDCSEC